MKYVVSFLAALMLSATVHAVEEVQLTATCGTMEEVRELISKTDEFVVFTGVIPRENNEVAYAMVTINTEQNTWSMIRINETAGVGCLTVYGENFQIDPPSQSFIVKVVQPKPGERL